MFRKNLFAFSTLTLALACSAQAFAQDFPTRPISMVMPFSAGGPGDTLARIIARGMSPTLKQQIVVENVPGAGGTIGSAKVARAAPDGYQLLLTHISHATNPSLYKKLQYDTLKDFEPIGLVAELPMTMVSKKDFPANNFKELLAYVKANKTKVAYANAGVGSASHLCGLMFMTAIDTELTTVPYKGTGPAMNDILGGQVDIMCDQTVNTLGFIKSQKIKAFGVTSKNRIAQLPELPTFDEAGVPKFELSIWYGLYAPKGTPKPVIDKLVAALQASLKDDVTKARFADLGAEVVGPDKAQPAALGATVKSEIDKWAPIIKKAGVYAD